MKPERNTREERYNQLRQTHSLLQQEIATHCCEEHYNTANYARLLHTSASVLYRHMKQVCGKTVKKLCVEKRLALAIHLLQQSNLQIQEIAYQLGFKEKAHFCNWFKKQTGITASSFRVAFFGNKKG